MGITCQPEIPCHILKFACSAKSVLKSWEGPFNATARLSSVEILQLIAKNSGQPCRVQPETILRITSLYWHLHLHEKTLIWRDVTRYVLHWTYQNSSLPVSLLLPSHQYIPLWVFLLERIERVWQPLLTRCSSSGCIQSTSLARGLGRVFPFFAAIRENN